MSEQAQLASAMTTKYSSTIELWAQQDKPVTEGLCIEDGETGVENISEDFYGVTTMRTKTTRDTELTKGEIPMTRRWVFSDTYYNMVAVDTSDQLRMRVDPAKGIGEAQVAAANRTKDKLFISASTAIAYGGKTFSQQISFPGAGTLAEGNTGFVLAKYDAGVEYLKRYGQMGPKDRIWCLWTSAEETTFMNVLQVASGDYTVRKFRDDGSIMSYGLVDFHRIEDLYDETGTLVERMMPYSTGTGTGGANVRTSLMGVKKAMKRWTPKGIHGYVWFNGSKDQYEINTKLEAGVARRLDRGIVALPCITNAP